MNFHDLISKYVPVKVRTSRFYLQYFFLSIYNYLFAEKQPKDFKEIPIIINNYNRLSFLLDLINCLEIRGYKNIHIIDNKSTYPPLIEYYERCPYTVYRLKENLGFLAFRKSGIYKLFKNKYFVYTDSDVVLTKDCPDDIIEYFYKELTENSYMAKVGCALKIDDLPDCYKLKSKVIEWESRFWLNPIGNDRYIAAIDTTFALHKPNFMIGPGYAGNRMRISGKYIAIHQPWYLDNDNLSEEETYYINSVRQSTFWTKQNKK